MIRFSVLLFSLVVALSGYSQHTDDEEFAAHCHFPEHSLLLGIGAPVSINNSIVGANFRMYYNVNEKVCFGPEYAYFKNAEMEIVDLNFVGHYIFELPLVGLYPLAGANYTVEKELHNDHQLKAALGLVLGLGIHRNFNNFTAFAEYSRVEFGLNDQFVTLGLMYKFE